MKHKIYLSRILPQKAMDLLYENFDVEVNPYDRVATKEEIIKGIKGKIGLISLLTDTIDSEIMDSNPDLKVISNYAVGFNNIDIKAATLRKIIVTNTPGVLTDTTADMAWALMLAISRRIVESDRFTREGKFKGWVPTLLLGEDIYGKTLGIIGMGRIGYAVAKRSIGFCMKVLYYDNKKLSNEQEKEINAKFVSLEDLLKESDFISIHLDLTEKTRHFIGEKELKLMKKTAFLINTSRGAVIDEKALVKALQNKEIKGAGLDVYENEPELTPGLIELDNVILTPHTASASFETRTKMGIMAIENLLEVLNGKIPKNIVNPEVLKEI